MSRHVHSFCGKRTFLPRGVVRSIAGTDPKSWWLTLVAMLTLLGGGCQSAHDAEPAPAGAASDEARDTAPAAATPAAATQREEAWDAVFMGGAKIGYSHTVMEPFTENGRQLLRLTNESELSMKRFDQRVKQKFVMTSIETLDGQVLRFESKMTDPPVEMTTRGHYEDGKLMLQTSTRGKTQAAEIEWNPAWGGFFAQELSLKAQPLQPGQQRTIRALLPVFNQAVELQLQAVDYERTGLLDGERELLKIMARVNLAGSVIESVVWTDRQGDTLKSVLPSLGQETIRTSKEIALAESDSVQFDLGSSMTVKVNRPLPQPHQTRRIVYRARIDDGDPAAAFATGLTQSVRRIDEYTAEIVVRAVRPEDSRQADWPDEQPPGEEDRAANNLIQSDDPGVVEMARAVAADQTDPWTVARALEGHVHRAVRVKNFSNALASAADVARSLEGDCTEHAVLLAALCRAREIPARVAIGLIYYGQASGFAYHMWTEVWIQDRWVPLDATLGQGGIGAAHLKVSQSNLTGVSPYAAFLPVFQVLGRLQLEILRVEGPG